MEPKEKIFTAAKICFKNFGLKNMTLACIAKEAGLTEKEIKTYYCAGINKL